MSKDILKNKILNENTYDYSYHHNEQESLLDNKYIDDNSLLLYENISQGFFDNEKTKIAFLFLKPMEWDSIDYISFLIFVIEKYNLKIKNIETNMDAIKEEYTVNDPIELARIFSSNPFSIPTQKINSKEVIAPIYKGAYKYFQEQKNKKTEPINLFKKFEAQKIEIEDIKKALTYTKINHSLEEDNPEYIAKKMFSQIVSWITFKIETTEEQRKKIKEEISTYLKLFIKDELCKNKEKIIRHTFVNQAKNIYTYKKHFLLFRDYLQEEYDNFGRTINIYNIFEDEFIEHKDNDYYSINDEMYYIKERFLNRKFLFFHILFSFMHQGLIKIIKIQNSGNWYEDSELRYEAKIEIKPRFLNKIIPKNLSFDPEKSIFYIKGNKIKIKKFGNEYHLLRVIFENPEEISQEWFFSDIKERVDENEGNDKRYSNALYQFRQKLEKISIKNFCTSTKQSFQINKEYLS